MHSKKGRCRLTSLYKFNNMEALRRKKTWDNAESNIKLFELHIREG